MCMISPVVSNAHTYSFEAQTELNNILINGDDVFIGAVNYIHRLNSNLAVIKTTETGPVNDSRKCMSVDDDCPSAVPTNNRNTLLLVYKKKLQLITCGSVLQGFCQFRNLSNLEVILEKSRPIAANDNSSSTVGFISKSRLHLAVTLKDRFESLTIYAVSIRQLDEDVDNLDQRTFLNVVPECHLEVNRDYVINYVSGFHLDEFAYFTSVQPITTLSKSFHSKIIRYCIDGPNFYSYTEIPLSCKDTSGTDYNILVAGMLLNATGKTAGILNVSNGESAYIGVFSRSAPDSRAQTESNAVCIFPMSAVARAFDVNIRQCIVHGVPEDGGLPWIKGYKEGITKCKVSIFVCNCMHHSITVIIIANTTFFFLFICVFFLALWHKISLDQPKHYSSFDAWPCLQL